MRSLGVLQKALALAISRGSPLIPSILPAQLRARGRARWPEPPPPRAGHPPAAVCPGTPVTAKQRQADSPGLVSAPRTGPRDPERATDTEGEPRSQRTLRPGSASRWHSPGSERPPAPGAPPIRLCPRAAARRYLLAVAALGFDLPLQPFRPLLRIVRLLLQHLDLALHRLDSGGPGHARSLRSSPATPRHRDRARNGLSEMTSLPPRPAGALPGR